MKIEKLVVAVVVILVAVAGSAARGPVTYTVGDSLGWTIPPDGVIPYHVYTTSNAYQAWATDKKFEVGDTLLFHFRDGIHDVAEVTKSAHDSGDTDAMISHSISDSADPPVRITLTTPGMHYFSCTAPGHCSAGQRLAITVAPTTSSVAASPPYDIVTPPSSTGSAPLPSIGAAPSPSDAAASRFSKSALLSQLGVVLAVGFVQQILM